MDHEFDRTDRNREEPPDIREHPETSPEPPPLDQPPKGPSAAHFREAARLAAARARKSIEQERTDSDFTARSDASEDTPVLDETTFAKAARKRAMDISGRDSQEPDSATTPANPAGSRKGKKATREAISQIDERLLLGARMLRAFESQIERLHAAADRAEALPEGLPAEDAPIESNPATDAQTESDAALERAEVTRSRLEEQTRKASESARSLANSIELAGGMTERQERWTEAMAETERSIDARIDSMLNRTEQALATMDERFRRVMEIERAIMTRIDQAMASLEQHLGSSRATPEAGEPSSGRTTTRQVPLIEVEALQRSDATMEEPDSETELPAATATPNEDDSPEALSVGTLSIDPSKLARRRERDH
ncbi:MAG: hypothetical protein VX641_07810 [Planctomycetota bacterium]|nr:hypothetical protein [Planctomycetota bacterium]